jgi:uridine phosphorylase
MKRAWYLGVTEEEVPEKVILVGDRSRVLRAAGMLEGARVLNEERGLTTTLGNWLDMPVMVSAFGMGAPIAAVVMHELADLGARLFVRAGTMMTRSPDLGTFIVAERALIHEGTSATYGYTEPEIDLDAGIAASLVRAADGEPVAIGTVASCDGFYTQMTDLLGGRGDGAELDRLWDDEEVIGVDMETSALASAARRLGVGFGSICLASVAQEGLQVMPPAERAAAEIRLLQIALNAITENRKEPT